MWPEISVRNVQRKVPIAVPKVEAFAVEALRNCLQLRKGEPTDLTKLGEIFIWLISDRRMSHLHRQFLGKTGPTDVVTFEHGEIFVSVETARRNARTFGNSLTRELQLYILHGLLHLHGFDDRTKAGARRMEKLQQKIFSECSADRPSHTAATV